MKMVTLAIYMIEKWSESRKCHHFVLKTLGFLYDKIEQRKKRKTNRYLFAETITSRRTIQPLP